MKPEEFDALTKVDGIHGEMTNGSLDWVAMPVKSVTSNFIQRMQDTYNVVLEKVWFDDHDNQMYIEFTEE